VQASDGPLLREKVIDVPGRFSKSALSLQVRAGRGNSITLGTENRDVITVVVRLVKYKLVTAISMGAGGHVDLLNETWIRHRIVPPGNYLVPQPCSPSPTRRSNRSLSQCGNWQWQTIALGQARRFEPVPATSASRPIADIRCSALSNARGQYLPSIGKALRKYRLCQPGRSLMLISGWVRPVR
jgi:hypothetical protein